jgi:hypothetical protein
LTLPGGAAQPQTTTALPGIFTDVFYLNQKWRILSQFIPSGIPVITSSTIIFTVSFDCHWKPVICQSMMGV